MRARPGWALAWGALAAGLASAAARAASVTVVLAILLGPVRPPGIPVIVPWEGPRGSVHAGQATYFVSGRVLVTGKDGPLAPALLVIHGSRVVAVMAGHSPAIRTVVGTLQRERGGGWCVRVPGRSTCVSVLEGAPVLSPRGMVPLAKAVGRQVTADAVQWPGSRQVRVVVLAVASPRQGQEVRNRSRHAPGE